MKMRSSESVTDISAIFYPKSCAIVGASSDSDTLGGQFLRSLLSFGYQGRIYPVNLWEDKVLGIKAYARLSDIPEPVDCATIAVPASDVPQAAEDCLACGIRVAQVLTSGFGETNGEGRILEDRLTRTASRGLRVLGPNCFGVYCPAGGVTILHGAELPKESGTVAFISQSGTYAMQMAYRASGWRIRFSKVVSYGNACDINESELLEYLCRDIETEVIAGYLEGVRDGARFFKTLREVAKIKPVILWKGGTTEAGASAVKSHTGFTSGWETAWDAVFKQSGVIRVSSLEGLVDAVLAFVHLGAQQGRRVAIISGGGGAAAVAVEACERVGLYVPPFSVELQNRLKSSVGRAGASFGNPVDIGTPIPNPSVLKWVLEAICNDGSVDTIIIDQIQMSKNPFIREGSIAHGQDNQGIATVPVDATRRFGKPIVAVLPIEGTGVSDMAIEASRRKVSDYYLSEGIPVYLAIERAARALANLVTYYGWREASL